VGIGKEEQRGMALEAGTTGTPGSSGAGIARIQSHHDDKGSNVNQINTIGAIRDNVAFGYGCFSVFRGETTLQNWPLRTWIAPSKRLILPMG